MADVFQEDLIAALTSAGSSHHEYEQNALGGQRDEHWSGYYAAYVLGRLGDFAPPTTLALWLEGISSTSNWQEAAASRVIGQLDPSDLHGLTQVQIEISCGNDKTLLPGSLNKPKSWPCSE